MASVHHGSEHLEVDKKGSQIKSAGQQAMVPLPNLSSASLNRPAHFISHRLPLDMSLLPQLSQHTKPMQHVWLEEAVGGRWAAAISPLVGGGVGGSWRRSGGCAARVLEGGGGAALRATRVWGWLAGVRQKRNP